MTTGLDSESESLFHTLKLPKKTKETIRCLLRHGLVKILEVTDGSTRIQFLSECDYGSDDLINELKKIFMCDSVGIYPGAGIKGNENIIDLDYEK